RMHGLYLARDLQGISGLHCIAFWGIPEIAIAMLGMKIWDVNGCDSNGDIPLIWAVKYIKYRVVELLLEHGGINPNIAGDGGCTAFCLAARRGDERGVKLLLEHEDVNPDSADSHGRTPLSFAASSGHEGVVKLLLERG